nr:MAG TPA: hypothetical protein [Caudoviricetes sp.]
MSSNFRISNQLVFFKAGNVFLKTPIRLLGLLIAQKITLLQANIVLPDPALPSIRSSLESSSIYCACFSDNFHSAITHYPPTFFIKLFIQKIQTPHHLV